MPPLAPATISDKQPKPGGTIPPRARSWFLIGLSLLIVVIIALTGDHLPREKSPHLTNTAPAPADPERIAEYEARLRAEQARLEALKRQMAEKPSPPPPPLPTGASAGAEDPLREEQRRRAYTSLFAPNVAFTRRGDAAARSGDHQAPAPTSAAPRDGTTGDASALPASTQAARLTTDEPHAPQPSPMAGTGTGATPRSHTLVEGTLIEAVLVNRLDGTYAGPIRCLVTNPVRSRDRQHLLIPAGTEVLGKVSPVTTFGQSRLAVSFHRLVFPDGRTADLNQVPGLNAIGETALRDRVNRRYGQLFGASLAVGLLSGLVHAGTGYGPDAGAGDVYRQGVSASLAGSTGRILDRYLNILPTVTIQEGHRIRIYLTGDLALPTYDRLGAAAPSQEFPQ